MRELEMELNPRTETRPKESNNQALARVASSPALFRYVRAQPTRLLITV
jgi:hypothetical protein